MTSDNGFRILNNYVYSVQQEIGATAAAVLIIQNDKIVNEWYSGKHDHLEDSRPVSRQSQFNVGSIRKTYLALAISLLIEEGQIKSIDDKIGDYLEKYGEATEEVTLRHLLTHTHGLVFRDGKLFREFPAGENWAYRNAGIQIMFELVSELSGHSLSAFLQKNVFNLYGLNETGWRTQEGKNLIYNYYRDPNTWVGPNDSGAGDQSNLFVSARDLAMWGYIHLNKGSLNGKQLLPKSVFERVVTLTTPLQVPSHFPRNGYIWWLQSDTPLNQLGERLPAKAIQVLGITGCACLVIPEYDAVAVRMYNQLSSPKGYYYLKDIRQFGNLVSDLLHKGTDL